MKFRQISLFSETPDMDLWVRYIDKVWQFDWCAGVLQQDLYYACYYFYFG